MVHRRAFLSAVGATALSATLGIDSAFARVLTAAPGRPRPPLAARLDRIGIQLYTLRREMERSVETTLARVAKIGYREVEFAGYFDKNPREIRALLERYGLAAPAAHAPFPALRDGWDRVLDAANEIGHVYVVVAWIPADQRQELDGYRRAAELFNRAGESARAAGLQFAYHNHDFEFVPTAGQIPYDVLLAETDPALVQLELDLYWITNGGHDPFTYFDRYPGRFPLVHVKDMDAGGRMVDVGAGTIDFPAIFARSEQAGIQHYFVEHDQPAVPFDTARASYEYLRQLEF